LGEFSNCFIHKEKNGAGKEASAVGVI